MPGEAALLRHGAPARRLRARHPRQELRGPAHQDRGQRAPPREPRRHGRLRAGLHPQHVRPGPLADADRARRDPALERLLAAVRLALEKERAGAGRGPALPDRHGHLAHARRADRRTSWRSSRRRSGSPGSRPAARTSTRGRAPRLRRGRRAALRLRPGGRHPLARERLPGQRPVDAARTCATSRRAAGPTRSNRLYVVEATPILTGARADHRRPMSPRRDRGLRARGRRRASERSRRGPPPTPSPRPSSADLSAHRGSSLVVAGETQPPAVHALAHAHQRRARQRRQDGLVHGARGREPVGAGRRALPSSRATWRRGASRRSSIVGGNPVFNAPADLEFGKAMEKVGAAHPPRPLQRRDLAPVPLARGRGAPARELERRPRRRRHGHDPAAADRAALLGQDRARAARRLLGRARALRRTTSSRTPGRASCPGAGDEAAWQKALHDGLVEGSRFAVEGGDACAPSLSTLNSRLSNSELPDPSLPPRPHDLGRRPTPTTAGCRSSPSR